jgi:tetratricopeptide (TPR) repeat protein
MSDKTKKLNLSHALKYAFIFMVLTLSISTKVWAQVATEINHLNEVTHLEIPNISPADYEIKKEEEKITLTLDAIDDESQKKLKGYTDRYIKKIFITKNSSLSKDIIEIYLSDKNIELFDYLTDSPSTLSMDFFAKEEVGDSDSEYLMTSKNKLQKKQTKNDTRIQINEEKDSLRGLASTEFIKSIGQVTINGDTSEIKKQVETEQEANKRKKETNKELLRIMRLAKQDAQNIMHFDLERIHFSKDSLIEGQNRIYIKYPALISEYTFLSDILKKNITYEVGKSEDQVTQDFLKVRKLYLKGDYKNFLKGKKIFEKKNPNSKYDEMVHHMEAESYLHLYEKENLESLFDRSLKIYDSLISKYPDSPVTERTLLLLSYLRLKDQKYFDAARNLRSYISRYEKSPLRENIELILAQTLIRLKEFQDAKKIYKNLFNSTAIDVKTAAYFEYGDVLFEEKDYQSSLKAYEEALKKFPGEDKNHANIYFNMGEAYFLIGNYKESLKFLRKFVEQNQLHVHVSYALTRMGEIFEMSEVNEKIWRGYFNESFFRFENKKGGAIAKINLLFHQAIASTSKKFDLLIKEIKSFDNKIDLPQANEYINFKISDVYYERGDYQNSIKILMDHFKSEQVPHHSDKFHRRIGRGLAAQLRMYIANKKIDEGMRLFDSTDELWFKKSERNDFSFYKAELYRLAQLPGKSAPEYEKFLIASSKNNSDTLDKSQRLPYLSEVYLRLAESYYEQKNISKAKENFSKIDFNQLMPLLKESYHRLSANISISDEKWSEAVDSLKKIENHDLNSITSLATILVNQNKLAEGVSSIDRYVDSGSLDQFVRFQALRKKLSLLEGRDEKKFNEVLPRFFNEFKNTKFEFDREKYLLGKNLIEKNKIKEAQEVFSLIQKNSYWEKMAQEVKVGEEWNQKYKKYINRIPAMNSSQEKVQ